MGQIFPPFSFPEWCIVLYLPALFGAYGSPFFPRPINQLKSMQEDEINDPSEKPIPEVSEQSAPHRLLLEEIRELEAKIIEVNQLLYRHSLEPSIRFQLKDDLEYFQQAIEQKRALLRQAYEDKQP